MKQLYNLTFKVVMVLVCLTSVAMAQTMSGTYTIDKSSAASSTNFTSFGSAVSALSSRGVSGAVTFDVKNGPYTEQVSISAITGASSTNTITFKGNSQTLQYSSTSSSNRHTIRLDGADWIRLEDLDIVALSSSYGRGVWLRNSADNNIIRNCKIRMPNMTSTSNSNAYVCLTQGTFSMTSYGDPGENNLIIGNKMSARTNGGPYSGVAIVNESYGSAVHSNTIRDNEIKDWYYAGIYGWYPLDQRIINNEIHNTGHSSSGYKRGIYMYNFRKGGNHTIDSNYIHSLTTYSRSYCYGIQNYAYYGNGNGGLRIRHNKFERLNSQYYTYGIENYAYYASIDGDYEITDNDIEIVCTSSSYYTQYGIRNYAYRANSFDNVYISRNHIDIESYRYAYGIYNYIYYANLSGECVIESNLCDLQASYYTYGIYTYAYQVNAPIHYYHNTIYSKKYRNITPTGYKYLFYTGYCAGNFKNNMLVTEDDGGTVYGIYNFGATMNYDYNNIFDDNAGQSAQIIFYDGSNQHQGSQGYLDDMGGDECFSMDPEFKDAANADFTPTSFAMVNKGTPIKGITTDVNGDARNATNPDVGAIDYFVDVTIGGFDMKGADGTNSSYECGNYTEDVTFSVTNNNADTISGVPVKYTINGVTQESYVMMDKIAPKASVSHTFSIPAKFNKPGMNEIAVALDGTDDVSSDNEAKDNINIVSSPSGFDFAEGGQFPGYYRDVLSGGTPINPDVTAPDSLMEYILENPSNYSNSDYGTTWDGTVSAVTAGGQPVTVSMSQNPSSSGNGIVQFTATKSLEDSMVYISYTIRDNSTLCDSTVGRWVYVIPAPVADFDISDVCDGTPVEYKSTSTISKSDVVLLYEWNFNDPKSTEDFSEIAEGVYTYQDYGQYEVEMNVKHSQYPKFNFVKKQTVVVTPVPTVDYKVVSACFGEDVTFTNNTSSPVPATITYVWEFGDGKSSTQKEPVYKYGQSGQYQVTLTATANGCSKSVTKNANQFALPVADFSWEGECVSQPIMLKGNNSIAIGKAGYEWTFDNGERRTNTDESFTWSTPGQKTVKLKAISEFNCQDSVEKQITIVDAPVADFEYSDPCNLSDISFTFSGKTVGVPLYSWDFNGESTSDVANPSVRFEEGEKTVKLRVETSQNNCVSEIEKSFRVKLQPEAEFMVEDVCEGEEAVFTNMSAVARGEMNFNWKFGDGQQSQSTNPRYGYNVGGETRTFNVTLVASVTGGCSDSITKTVTVNELPAVGFTIDRRGRTVGVTPSGNTSNYTFKRWTFGDGGSSTEDAPVYTYNNVQTGRFEICFSAQSTAGCLNTDCQEVTIDLLGAEEIESGWLKVYPNPSAGMLQLEVEGSHRGLEILVHNQLGSEVYRHAAGVETGRYTLDLSNLSSGVYLIRVNNDGQSAVRQIQIIR